MTQSDEGRVEEFLRLRKFLKSADFSKGDHCDKKEHDSFRCCAYHQHLLLLGHHIAGLGEDLLKVHDTGLFSITWWKEFKKAYPFADVPESWMTF